MNTPGLFITGTDTGVGKTHVAALIARQLASSGVRAGAYKPVCSGSERNALGEPVWEDIEALHAAIGGMFPRERICSQRFLARLAPPVAAAEEGRTVDWDALVAGLAWWDGRVDALLVEGVGGWLCPLTQDRTIADFAQEADLPCLIVAHDGLGTINHTLLSIESIRARHIPIAGVLLNSIRGNSPDASSRTNADEIARRGGVPVLGVLSHGPEGVIRRDGKQVNVDWVALAQQV